MSNQIDYNDVRPQFKNIENEQDEKKLTAAENKSAFLHPKRIQEITQYRKLHLAKPLQNLAEAQKKRWPQPPLNEIL